MIIEMAKGVDPDLSLHFLHMPFCQKTSVYKILGHFKIYCIANTQQQFYTERLILITFLKLFLVISAGNIINNLH